MICYEYGQYVESVPFSLFVDCILYILSLSVAHIIYHLLVQRVNVFIVAVVTCSTTLFYTLVSLP